MTKPTLYQDTSSGFTPSQPPSTGLLTVDLKHIPLVIGLLLGAGGGGSLGSYMSSDTKSFGKIVARLEAIEKTLHIMQRDEDKSSLIMTRLTEDVKNHVQNENSIHKKFEDRLRDLEKLTYRKIK